MSKEFSAAMAVGSPCSGSPPARHYTERRSGLLFPPDAGRRRELAGLGEGAVAGELEAGEIALAVVIGDLDHPQRGGVDGERGVAQLPGLALRRERDRDLAVRRGAGDRAVARLEVVDAEQQEVEARLVLAVDAVAAPGVVLGVPGLDHVAAEQEALRIGLLVVPAQAVGEVQREAAALLLAGREAGRHVGLREGRGRRPRLHQAAAHPRQPRPGVGGEDGEAAASAAAVATVAAVASAIVAARAARVAKAAMLGPLRSLRSRRLQSLPWLRVIGPPLAAPRILRVRACRGTGRGAAPADGGGGPPAAVMSRRGLGGAPVTGARSAGRCRRCPAAGRRAPPRSGRVTTGP